MEKLLCNNKEDCPCKLRNSCDCSNNDCQFDLVRGKISDSRHKCGNFPTCTSRIFGLFCSDDGKKDICYSCKENSSSKKKKKKAAQKPDSSKIILLVSKKSFMIIQFL